MPQIPMLIGKTNWVSLMNKENWLGDYWFPWCGRKCESLVWKERLFLGVEENVSLWCERKDCFLICKESLFIVKELMYSLPTK